MDPHVIASLKTEIEAQQMRLSRQTFGTNDHMLEMQRLVAMQNQMERYQKAGEPKKFIEPNAPPPPYGLHAK